MLSDEELRRRLIAGRTLRGLKQEDLANLLAQDGLGKHDLGKIERGQKTFQRIHREAVTRLLRLPERWFTEEDVDVIVGVAPPPELSAEATRDLLARLLADLDQAADQARQGTRRPPADEDRREPGAGAGGA